MGVNTQQWGWGLGPSLPILPDFEGHEPAIGDIRIYSNTVGKFIPHTQFVTVCWDGLFSSITYR